MIKRIHVNQHVIRKNKKTGERKPPLTVKTYKSNVCCHEVLMDGPCKIVYSPDHPLVVWIETKGGVECIKFDGGEDHG